MKIIIAIIFSLFLCSCKGTPDDVSGISYCVQASEALCNYPKKCEISSNVDWARCINDTRLRCLKGIPDSLSCSSVKLEECIDLMDDLSCDYAHQGQQPKYPLVCRTACNVEGKPYSIDQLQEKDNEG